MADFHSINLRDVERRRDAIVNQVLSQYYSQPVNIEQLTRALLGELPQGITYDQIFESVRYLSGRSLTDVDAIRLAWRLAANIPALRAGRPVAPWTVQHVDEWVPLQVLRVQKTRNSKDKIGYEVTTRVMAGTPAPLKIISFWGVRVVRFVAFKVGFSWKQYKFTKCADLVGLRFYGLIEAARSRGKPEFHEIECPDSMVKWNRDNVLRLRMRVGMKCPVGFTHQCHQCAYGYDRCPAGTHAKTFTVGPCAGCGNQEAAFDPDEIHPHCVQCAALARIRKRT